MTEPRSKAPLAIAIVAVGTLLLGVVAVWTVLKKPASQAVQTQASMPIVAPRAARVPVQRPQWIWTSEPNTQEAIFTRAFVLEQAAEVAALVDQATLAFAAFVESTGVTVRCIEVRLEPAWLAILARLRSVLHARISARDTHITEQFEVPIHTGKPEVLILREWSFRSRLPNQRVIAEGPVLHVELTTIQPSSQQ